jgi:hypothetical protein
MRPAATLTEVLVAIFVMGIGLLALLSLFPLGALSMAQAIKDDRTAQAAKDAFAIAEMFNIHNDAFLYQPGTPGATFTVGPFSYTDAFVNPYPFPSVDQSPPGMPALTDPTRPSYPVYVDPYAFYFLSSQALIALPTAPNTPPTPPFSLMVGQTVGNTGRFPPPPPAPGLIPGTGIPRRSLSFLPTSQSTIRWFTLLDDITFHDNAMPYPSSALPGTVAVQRENRYSWAYMLRRPKAGDPTVVDISVVVYSGRSLSTLGETPYTAGVDPITFQLTQGIRFDPTLKYVDIAYPTGQAPPVRRGSWILDATVVAPLPPPQGLTPDPHGYFYRVVEVTDLGALGAGVEASRLELQTNPKAASYFIPAPGSPAVPYGVLVVMENVVEVFDKGSGWKP